MKSASMYAYYCSIVCTDKKWEPPGHLPVSRAGLKELLYTGSMEYYVPVEKNGLNMYLLTWKDKHDTLRKKPVS